MDPQRFFADVDLPFHVWVREGRRWVLRDASRLERDAGGGEGGEARRGRTEERSRR